MDGYKCTQCGNIYSILKLVCPVCKSRKFLKIDMGSTCTLMTYTELWVTPSGFERPLKLGIVKFPNGGTSFGQIISKSPKIGMILSPVWKELGSSDGQHIWGFAFEEKDVIE